MSTYSSDLKLELIGTGEASGTWGDDTNNNLNLIQQAIAGVETVTLSSGGTLALAMTNKTISNARNMVIKFTTASIAASTICTVPDSIEKFYIFDATGLTNPTNLQIKTASGSGFTLDAAKIYAAYTDGTNLTEISLDTLGGSVAAASITGTIATSQIADDAVTLAKMAPGTDGNIISYDASGNPVAVATGTCGQVLTSAGAGAPPTFQDAGGGGAISWNTTPITADPATAVSGTGYFANTSSASFTITLPASPSAGDIVAIKDYANTFLTNNLTLGRNGSNVAGVAADAILSIQGIAVTIIYVDATKGWLVVNSGTQSDAAGAEYICATSPCIATVGDYKIHTFTSSNTFTVNASGNSGGSNRVDYLVVAGGGGAQNTNGAGGGAGGYRESNGASSGCYSIGLPANSGVLGSQVCVQAYTITIGAGGTNGQPVGTSGSPSVFAAFTAAGGGAGAGQPCSTGTAGGSGGGGPHGGSPSIGGAGNTPPVSPSQGNPGGKGVDNKTPTTGSKRGGVGGGASTAGPDQTPTVAPAPERAGGAGATSNINNTPTARGGGGGSGAETSPATGSFPVSVGGVGGGGDGARDPGGTQATAGTVNTGGGGGGGGDLAPTDGKNGGSGIVILRYKFQN